MRRALRYLIAVVLGLVCGTIWGLFHVDWPPIVFPQLSQNVILILTLIPLLISLGCSIFVTWWGWGLHALFSVIASILWSIGSAVNYERMACGCGGPFGLEGYAVTAAMGMLLLTLPWALTRVTRYVYRRFRPRH